MDKATENLPEEVNMPAETSDMEDKQDATEQQVIIKKSGAAMLSLTMSVLALAVSGYLLFQSFFTQKSNTDLSEIAQLNQKLYQANHVLSTDLANSQLTIKDNQKLLQDLAEQLSGLQKIKSNDSPVFDNSENLALFEQLHEQLDQQKNLFDKMAAEQRSEPTIKPVIDQDSQQRQATLNQLRLVQLMLNNNQLPQAIRTLESHLDVGNLKPSIQVKLKQLLLELNSIKQVDKKSLFSELDQLQNQVAALTLETETDEVIESNWYDKFISIKKLKIDNSLANSTELAILKADLAQHIIQAKIALSLADQDSWQFHLDAAAQKIKLNLSNHSAMTQQVAQLSQQTVTPELPEGINFQSIINELTRVN